MINHIDVVYAENDTERLGPIGPGVVYDEYQIGQ